MLPFGWSPLVSNFSVPFINPLETVPSAPIGIIVTFMYHSFFSSLARFRYLSFFSILLCGLPGRQSPQFGRVFFFVDYYYNYYLLLIFFKYLNTHGLIDFLYIILIYNSPTYYLLLIFFKIFKLTWFYWCLI